MTNPIQPMIDSIAKAFEALNSKVNAINSKPSVSLNDVQGLINTSISHIAGVDPASVDQLRQLLNQIQSSDSVAKIDKAIADLADIQTKISALPVGIAIDDAKKITFNGISSFVNSMQENLPDFEAIIK